MATLQSITDEMLIRAIDAARRRVVFIAPAVWEPVAQAIARAWQRLGGDGVTAVLDVDAEVCRFGYGSLPGLQILQKAADSHGQSLGNEPGVRICVVMADDQTFIYSPTPKLLEPSPGEITEAASSKPKTNGIVLKEPPPSLSDEVGAGPEKDLTRTVGLDPVPPSKLEKVANDLKTNPPKSFDLALAVQVYNAQIQFVDFKVNGCCLSDHRAQLPKDLIHIAKRNKVLAEKITNSIKLLDGEHELVTNGDLSETTIMTMRAKIEHDLLIHVPGGTVFKRASRAELEKRIAELNETIIEFSEKAAQALADHFVDVAENLAEELLPSVMEDIPERWRRFVGSSPKETDVKVRIKDALLRSFGDATTKVSRMKATAFYKDVTYEMLCDPQFTKVIAKHFEGLPTMEKFQAAKERPPAKTAEPELFNG